MFWGQETTDNEILELSLIFSPDMTTRNFSLYLDMC